MPPVTRHLTINEVARTLSVHYMTIWRKCQSGELVYTLIGRSVRISADAVEDYLRREREKTVARIAIRKALAGAVP